MNKPIKNPHKNNYFSRTGIRNNTIAQRLRNGIFDFENAPVYTVFLSIMLVVNIGFFIFGFFPIGRELSKDVKGSIPLYFGAINKSAILRGYQFWRFFTFAFIERSNGFNVLFTGIFIFLTFCRIGYQTEITFGSRNTAIMWIFGMISMGLLHFGISKFERLYFYGTHYFSLLSIGALFFYWIMQISISEQENNNIRNLIWQTLLLVIVMIIFNYVHKSVFITEKADLSNSLIGFRSWTVLTPMIVFSIGFFAAAILIQKQYESLFLFWLSVGFCAIIAISALSMFIYVYISESKQILENPVWNLLKDKFWHRLYK